MRSTLTLDPDVVALIREAMHAGRRTFKDVVNEALRTALDPAAGQVQPPYRVSPHEGGLRPEFLHLNPNTLAAEFEDEGLQEKLRRGAGAGSSGRCPSRPRLRASRHGSPDRTFGPSRPA